MTSPERGRHTNAASHTPDYRIHWPVVLILVPRRARLNSGYTLRDTPNLRAQAACPVAVPSVSSSDCRRTVMIR